MKNPSLTTSVFSVIANESHNTLEIILILRALLMLSITHELMNISAVNIIAEN